MRVDWVATRHALCLDGTWTSDEKNEYERAWVFYLCLQRYVELCEQYGHVEDFSTWSRWREADYHHGLARECERLNITRRCDGNVDA